MKHTFFLILTVLLLACTPQAPQLPANKTISVDSSKIALIIANQQLIIYEDSILTQYVNSLDSQFIKDKQGFWYKINTKTNLKSPTDSEECNIIYGIYSLDNKMLYHRNEKIIVGKKNIVVGLEELVKIMHRNETASLVLPWYLGYGLKGDDKLIQPYTSLKVFVQIK